MPEESPRFRPTASPNMCQTCGHKRPDAGMWDCRQCAAILRHVLTGRTFAEARDFVRRAVNQQGLTDVMRAKLVELWGETGRLGYSVQKAHMYAVAEQEKAYRRKVGY